MADYLKRLQNKCELTDYLGSQYIIIDVYLHLSDCFHEKRSIFALVTQPPGRPVILNQSAWSTNPTIVARSQRSKWSKWVVRKRQQKFCVSTLPPKQTVEWVGMRLGRGKFSTQRDAKDRTIKKCHIIFKSFIILILIQQTKLTENYSVSNVAARCCSAKNAVSAAFTHIWKCR